MSALDVVLERLGGARQNGDGWQARCPAHDDREPSLSVSQRSQGDPGVVIYCHAGCTPDEVAAALGLSTADLFDDLPTPAEQRRVVATYDYLDETGTLLFQVVRFEPKTFRQRRPDGRGGWVWKLGDTRMVLYRLPELLAADVDQPVYVAEGEKDVDALVRVGCIATCGPQGAGKWSKVSDVAREALAGRSVIVVADRDTAGMAHGRDVAASLRGVAAEVVVVEAAVGKDAADHLAAGRTVEEFLIVDETEPTTVVDEESSPLVDPSFEPVDLAPVLAGTWSQPEPEILRRDDDRGLFYRQQINGVHGDSGTGKGWAILAAVVDELRRGHNVVVIDLEDTAPSIVARLRILGATDTVIGDQLTYLRPSAPFGVFAVDHLIDVVTARNPRMVVIDSLGEAFGLDGIDENSDAEVGPWLRRVARRLADAGPAVVLVDHSTKANDNPLHPSGSKRKRAAIGGASYLIEASTPLVAGSGGRLRITCAKDRHGTYARSEHVADFVLTTDPTGGTRWALYAPDDATNTSELPIFLAARAAVTACRDANEELSLRRVLERMTIKGRRDLKIAGIDEAVARGALIEAPGANRARLFSYASDLPEGLQ